MGSSMNMAFSCLFQGIAIYWTTKRWRTTQQANCTLDIVSSQCSWIKSRKIQAHFGHMVKIVCLTKFEDTHIISIILPSLGFVLQCQVCPQNVSIVGQRFRHWVFHPFGRPFTKQNIRCKRRCRCRCIVWVPWWRSWVSWPVSWLLGKPQNVSG